MADDVYTNLKKKLKEQGGWPQPYMFKFIIPSDNKKLAQVEAIFGSDAQVTTRLSKSNKYISVTAKEVMISPEEVINTYKKAEGIEGLISL